MIDLRVEEIPFHRFNTIVVGSGAAGYNAALSLSKGGEQSVAIVTEGRGMGTSRNTGSDKQTYYKLTTCGEVPDSVYKMAQTLFEGGAVDGDIALAEAAGSLRSFYQLVDLGIPFPYNSSGEFVGYKTDHDPLQRGTSAGPLTSKYMTDLLEEAVIRREIPQFSGFQAVKLLVDDDAPLGKQAVGILALDKRKCSDSRERYVIFAATNIVWATGGDAGMYESSVYPTSQTGGMGVVLEEGAKAKNLTESQFGIASIKFRWNLSGTFQQCLPRYVSTDQEGNDEREFLEDFFVHPSDLLSATFLKGYQWPFDSGKVVENGSSIVDLLVYKESVLNKRRVFLDFTRNPAALLQNGVVDFTRLNGEAKEYLENSEALLETPYERLQHMNPKAIKVYSDHNIDLSKEYLEVAVCVQHGNGGIACDDNWESSISHLFAIGEVSGTHGVYRPGGSALNSGQVGGMRAAQFITRNYKEFPDPKVEFLQKYGHQVKRTLQETEVILTEDDQECLDVSQELAKMQERMTTYASLIRSREGVEQAIKENREQWNSAVNVQHAVHPLQLKNYFKLRHLLISQYVHLCAILDYVKTVKSSRGSALIYNPDGLLPDDRLDELFRHSKDCASFDKVQEVMYEKSSLECDITWRAVRPLPDPDHWFESVWKNYREREGL